MLQQLKELHRVHDGIFADGGAFVLLTRHVLISGTNILYSQLRRFGLICHVSRNGSASKLEAMFFPAANRHVADGDTTPFMLTAMVLSHFAQNLNILED